MAQSMFEIDQKGLLGILNRILYVCALLPTPQHWLLGELKTCFFFIARAYKVANVIYGLKKINDHEYRNISFTDIFIIFLLYTEIRRRVKMKIFFI